MSIHLKNLEFCYPKNPCGATLKIDSWSVHEGEKRFIWGDSGTGKSTLLNLIAGLLTPTVGEVIVDNQPLYSMTSTQRDKFRASNIGYIFQRFNLINYLSVIDNIKLAAYFSKSKKLDDTLEKRIEDLLERLNISPFLWQQPVEKLSVGQQQRIAIARAFINQPRLLIADEPTSSLDKNAADKFIKLLFALCQTFQSTLLFVSHDEQLKMHFDSAQSLSSFNQVQG
ncbi:ABC transporter ATP-binding protein [Endozoicomonas sp. G2_1]|uniref:ABC transporter ATP-binding protein n=1 Tax=Endozoicomonas sp. G2_1 TaxID=2821091 RepID=UPI001ADAA3FB|nr:ABC transporter ATP-binding protein [Endozoicomonas sp. G2_1]MBO9490584.1 ABC transporter ATP-binding protein [Endozoicomonas sp. G2_1]